MIDWSIPAPSRDAWMAFRAAGRALTARLQATGHTRAVEWTGPGTGAPGWVVSPAAEEGAWAIHYATTEDDHAGRRAGLAALAATLEAQGVPYHWDTRTDPRAYETLVVRAEDIP